MKTSTLVTRVLFIVFAVILTLACSRVSMMVRMADTYVYWSLDDYLDFTSSQKSSFKNAIAKAMEDLKADIIPVFVTHLKDVTQQFEAQFPTSEVEAEKFVQSQQEVIEKNLKFVLEKALPHFRGAIESLEMDNWQSLKKEFSKQNEKILSQKNRCADRYEERLEDWVGSLDKHQLSEIASYCKNNPWNPELRVKNRQHLLQVFEKEAGIDSASFSAEKVWKTLTTWFEKMPENEITEFKEMKSERQKALKQSLKKMLMSLSAGQQKKLIENLKSKTLELESTVPKKAAG